MATTGTRNARLCCETVTQILWLMMPLAPDVDDLLARPTWFGRARCRGQDPSTFFPSYLATASKAKAYCSDCAVCDECLDYAIRRPELGGVWGGRTERERARLRESRKTTPQT